MKRYRMRWLIIAVAMAVFAPNAQAAQETLASKAKKILVGRVLLEDYSRENDEWEHNYDYLSFECSGHDAGDKLCRKDQAWVEMILVGEMTQGSGDDWGTYNPDNRKYLKFHLPGLKYSRATRQIKYHSVVCATVERNFGADVTYETGSCQLSHKVVPRQGRNGIEYIDYIYMTVP
jgi:hypothetical protein